MPHRDKREWGWRLLFVVAWLLRLAFIVAWYLVVVLGWVGVLVLELLLGIVLVIADPKSLRELIG